MKLETKNNYSQTYTVLPKQNFETALTHDEISFIIENDFSEIIVLTKMTSESYASYIANDINFVDENSTDEFELLDELLELNNTKYSDLSAEMKKIVDEYFNLFENDLMNEDSDYVFIKKLNDDTLIFASTDDYTSK